MATGYTTKICAGEQSLSEFVLGCARAFGACIEQRDDPMDDLPKIPKTSNQERDKSDLANMKKELATLRKMSKQDRIELGEKKQKKEVTFFKKRIKEKKIVRARLVKMLKQVNDWIPPSKDHDELKKFMIDQLNSTIQHDGDTEYYSRQLSEEERKTPLDYYDEELKSVNRRIENEKENIKKLQERTADRGKWITDLYESLSNDPALSHLLLKKGIK